MMPFLPDQKAISQHHQDSVAMKAFPQLTLVVIPSQEILAVMVKPLNLPSPMSHFHQLLQGSACREVGEVVFPVALPSAGTLSMEPAQGERLATQTTVGPHRNKPLTKPAFVPLSPADDFPLAFGNSANHCISPLCLRTVIPVHKDSKVAGHTYNIGLSSLLQSRQEGVISPIAAISNHSPMRNLTLTRLIQKGQGEVKLNGGVLLARSLPPLSQKAFAAVGMRPPPKVQSLN